MIVNNINSQKRDGDNPACRIEELNSDEETTVCEKRKIDKAPDAEDHPSKECRVGFLSSQLI